MTAAFIIAAICPLSCVKDEGRNGCEECLLNTVSFKIESQAATKSSYTCEEDRITSFSLMIYSGNHLVTYESTGKDPRNQEFVFKLPAGQYDCYAVANIDGFRPEDYYLKDHILNLYVDTDGQDFNRTGFPMVWTYTRYISIPKDRNITVNLERVVSRWEFAVDFSELPELVIRSVRMVNIATSVKAFRTDNYVEYADGDYATGKDLQRLNNGSSMVFYVPENLQGELLSGNTDPYEKNYNTLSSIASSRRAGRCTYLELSAEFDPMANEGNPRYTGGIIYRFYLGKNDTSNFDITRNTNRKITLTPTLLSPEAIRPDGGQIVWKAEADIVKYDYRYVLQLSKDILTGEGETFTTTVWKHIFKDGVESNDPVDVTESFSFSSDDPHITMSREKGMLEAGSSREGTATITAKDARGNQCSAEISWNVSSRDPATTVGMRYYVSLSPAEMGSSRGSFKARIIAETSTYADGVLIDIATRDITDEVDDRTFTSDNPDAIIDNAGNGLLDIKIEKGGSALIHASGKTRGSGIPLTIEPAELTWEDALVSYEYTYILEITDVNYIGSGIAPITRRGTFRGRIMQEARKYINGTFVAGPYKSNITAEMGNLEFTCAIRDVIIDYRDIDGYNFQIGRIETSHDSGEATIYATGRRNGVDVPIIPGVLKWNFQ